MTVAQARTEIETFTQWNSFPALTTAEVDRLLAKAKRASQPLALGAVVEVPLTNNVMPSRRVGSVPPDAHSEWAATTAYALGATVVPTPRNAHFYRVTVAGTSGATQPNFPTTAGATVADGTVTWAEAGAALWVPTFNLAYAIALGWRLKAAKVATAYDFASNDQKLTRSQMFKHCMEQHEHWKKAANESLELQGAARARRSGSVPSANDDRLWCECDDDALFGPERGVAVSIPGGGRVVWSDVF